MNPNQSYPQYPSQTYAQQAYPSSTGNVTSTTTTVQSTRVVAIRPYFDIQVCDFVIVVYRAIYFLMNFLNDSFLLLQYFRTIPGLLKIVQLVRPLAFVRSVDWLIDWLFFIVGFLCFSQLGLFYRMKLILINKKSDECTFSGDEKYFYDQQKYVIIV